MVPQTSSDQELAADLLRYYFNEVSSYPNTGCGGLNIDGYLNASDANPNSASAGEETGGDVEATYNGSNPKYSVEVGLPDGTSFTVNY